MKRQKLLNLPKTGVEKRKAFSLVPWVYEDSVARQNGGLDLSKLSYMEVPEKEVKHYRSFVPFFSPEGRQRKERGIAKLVEQFEGLSAPCSLKLKSLAELEEHISRIYQLSYAHYVVAKNEIPWFPDSKCNLSATNLLLALFSAGYPMALATWDNQDEHAYNIVPFSFSPRKNGVILVDPTSDQMWHPGKGPRNFLWVSYGPKWNYETSWGHGADLFPNALLGLKSLREMPNGEVIWRKGLKDTNVKKYMYECFRNPVKYKGSSTSSKVL